MVLLALPLLLLLLGAIVTAVVLLIVYAGRYRPLVIAGLVGLPLVLVLGLLSLRVGLGRSYREVHPVYLDPPIVDVWLESTPRQVSQRVEVRRTDESQPPSDAGPLDVPMAHAAPGVDQTPAAWPDDPWSQVAQTPVARGRSLNFGALLLAGGLVLGVGLLLCFKGSRPVGLGMLVLLVLLGLPALWWSSSRTDGVRREVRSGFATTTAPLLDDSPGVLPGRVIQADMYPSKLAAARALGRQVVQAHRDATGNQPVGPLVISGDLGRPEAWELAQTLRREYQADAIIHDAAADPPSTHTRALTLHIASFGTGGDTETLQVELRSGDGPVHAASARWADKPWVEDFAQWTQVGRGGWIVTHSRLHATRDEARNEALDQAALELVGRSGIIRYRDGQVRDPEELRAQTAIARDIIEQAGRAGATDQFAQQFSRPYGDVYQWHVLVDTNLAHDVARQAAIGQRQQRSGMLRVVVSTAGMLGAIILTYLLLNSMTRGYYVRGLRVTAVVLATAGLLMVLLLLR